MNYTWIRTSDRYPPNGVEVLAWIVGGSLHHGEDYYDKALYLNGVWRANCGDRDEPVLVSHWMPRPQAPKDQVMLSAEERDLTVVAQLLEWLKEQERQMSASAEQRPRQGLGIG